MIWVLLVSAVLVVLATSLIKFADLSTKVKNLIAVVLSVLVGGAVWFATGGADSLSAVTDVNGLLAVVAVIYGFAQVLYHFLLDGTQLDAKLESFAAPKTDGGGDDPGA